MPEESTISKEQSRHARGSSAIQYQRIAGANDRIGVAVVGCGVRGLDLAVYIQATGGAEVRGVSDVYRPRLERFAKGFGPFAKPFEDYRAVLDSADIDAVVISTPDHWHTPMAIAAVRSGKHVYVEKPVTHRLEEGPSLLQAVEESRQIVASGTQQRSWKHYLEAKQMIDQGVLGQVTFVRCHWSQDYSRMRAGPEPPTDPARLAWEQWLGPAPRRPFDPTRFRYWRFFWDYGGGSVTDLMTHWIDVVQWFLGSTRTERVQAVGLTYVQDWMEAPDTVVATMQFPEGFLAVYEGNMTFGLLGCGIEFRGDKAMMIINRVGYSVYEEGTRPLESVTLPEPMYRLARSDETSRAERVDGTGTLDNVRNWIGCIRTGGRPNAHIRAAVESAATSHWVNKAIRAERSFEVSQ